MSSQAMFGGGGGGGNDRKVSNNQSTNEIIIQSSNAKTPLLGNNSSSFGSKSKTSVFDLETQFEFYGQYHTNPINVLAHVICVPLIFFSAIVLVHSSPIFRYTEIKALDFEIPRFLTNNVIFGFIYGKPGTMFKFNLSTVTSIGYGTFFTILEPFAGGILGLLLISAGHWSNLIYDSSVAVGQESSLMKQFWIIFVAAWILQFVGHGKFEKRAPALIDSLFQSLVLAVLFVWLEVWFFLGYRPELKNRLKVRIDRAVTEYRSQKANKNKNKTTQSNISQ